MTGYSKYFGNTIVNILGRSSLKKINIIDLFCSSIFVCVYMLPVYYFENYNLELDKYIYAAILIISYFSLILKEKKMKSNEIAFIFFVLFIILIKKQISYLHLIGLPFALHIIENKQYVNRMKKFLLNSKIIYISLAFVIVYSILYFGYDDRYIFTGIKEPNLSGFAIFILFIIIRIRNRKLGDFLLLCGILSFSKSYLLALIIYFTVYNRKLKRFNIKIISVIFIILLILLSNFYIFVENKGFLKEYQTGIKRYFVLLDYSNYYRFTVNTNLLKVYENNPNLLLTGIENEDFFKYNFQVTKQNNTRYFQIKPHNYFFSYFQKYGMWSIIIFMFTLKIFDKEFTEKNNSVSIPIFFYLMFLGIGATSYWIFLSNFALIMTDYDKL